MTNSLFKGIVNPVDNIKTPITADRCSVVWDGEIVASASQVAINFNQQITRRRTVGNQFVLIHGSQPYGSITIARLVIADGDNIFSKKGWNNCEPATIEFRLGACTGDGRTSQVKSFVALGCMVSGFNISATAEDLTVMDNIAIEFLDLQIKNA